MNDAKLLTELVNTRIDVNHAYSMNIIKLCDDPSTSLEAIDALQAERDETVAELTKKINALREKIAE